MEKIFISACLLGEKVRYDGNSLRTEHAILQQWMDEGRLVSLCPEVSAGMSIPRAPAEILAGHGEHVLLGTAKVVEKSGFDVTDAFLKGASNALTLCQKHDIKTAVLADFSPSCGSSKIFDGHFSKVKIQGSGVTASLLSQHGIKVFSQHQLSEVNQYLHHKN